jgi:hypothetical protein
VSAKKNLLDAFARTLMQGADAVNDFVRGLNPQDARTVREAIQNRPPAKPPVPAQPAAKPTQLRLGLTQPGAGSQAWSPRRQFTERNAETLQQLNRPRIGETVQLPPPPVAGQLDLFESAPAPNFTLRSEGPRRPAGLPVALSSTAQNLAQTDPGTFSSIRDLATKAEDFYGINRGGLLNALVEPGGTDVLKYLGEGADLNTAIKRATSGGGMVPTRPLATAVYEPGGALVQSPGGRLAAVEESIPVDVRVIEDARNLLGNAAGGIQMGDLSKLALAKRALALAGGVAAGTQIPNVARRLFGEDDGRDLGNAPGVPDDQRIFGVPSAPGTPTATPDIAALQEAVAALQQTDPLAGEAAKALMPMSPERYSSAEAYRADQARAAQAIPAAGLVNSLAKQYAQEAATAAPKRAELADYMRGYATAQGMTPEEQAGLGNWALSNPTLAYRFQQEMMKRPDLSQQTGESVTTQTPVTQLGSDTQANVTGNVIFGGEAVATGNPGASDLAQATEPMPQPYLQRTQELIQRMAPRSRMYAGY